MIDQPFLEPETLKNALDTVLGQRDAAWDEVDKLREQRDTLYIALADLNSATSRLDSASRRASDVMAAFNEVMESEALIDGNAERVDPASTCGCWTSPGNAEGPHRDCLVHGECRAVLYDIGGDVVTCTLEAGHPGSVHRNLALGWWRSGDGVVTVQRRMDALKAKKLRLG